MRSDVARCVASHAALSAGMEAGAMVASLFRVSHVRAVPLVAPKQNPAPGLVRSGALGASLLECACGEGVSAERRSTINLSMRERQLAKGITTIVVYLQPGQESLCIRPCLIRVIDGATAMGQR